MYIVDGLDWFGTGIACFFFNIVGRNELQFSEDKAFGMLREKGNKRNKFPRVQKSITVIICFAADISSRR